jgi:hypothetical protein
MPVPESDVKTFMIFASAPEHKSESPGFDEIVEEYLKKH